MAAPALSTPPRKPRLAVRVHPAIAFPPATVLVTAELVGGDDHQDFYCPEQEWVWNDGARSVRQSDCEPANPETKIERHFSARHSFQLAGEYDVTLRLRRADRVITQASAPLIMFAPSAR
jgi:hypothetical protein